MMSDNPFDNEDHKRAFIKAFNEWIKKKAVTAQLQRLELDMTLESVQNAQERKNRN